jgi:hypothetical protein
MDHGVKEFIVQRAMSADDKFLEEIKNNTFAHINDLLATKGEEYSLLTNRLENFLAGASMDRTTPEQALYDMMKKHWLSVQKFVWEVITGKRHSSVTWSEKTDDIITYCILLKAMVIKREEIEETIDKQTKVQADEREELQRKADELDEQAVGYEPDDGEDDDYAPER